MAGIPKKFSRRTSHAKPKYQLYQPGFNPCNGCWLEGAWVTVTAAEWKKRAAHEHLYRRVHTDIKAQHHRDKGVALKSMTRAQRQAYEYFSGMSPFEGVRDGLPACVSLRMAGSSPQKGEVKFLQRETIRFPRYIKRGARAKPQDQFRGYKFPADLIDENTPETAFDVLSAVVKMNRERTNGFFEANVEAISTTAPPPGEVLGMDFQQFSAAMAFQGLIEQEETIIRAEWCASRGEDDGIPVDLAEETKLYIGMRAKLKAKMSNFDEHYENERKSHNECERHNLDNSKGHLFCFVLPHFNDDGTHDPWGPKDVPWAVPLRKKRQRTLSGSP